MTDALSNQTFSAARAATQQSDELDSLRQRAFKNDESALKEAAQQFESIFMSMVMKSMREANAVFEEGNPLNTRYSGMYRDMYDQQLSKDLSKQGSLGLADLLVQQLGGGGEGYQPAGVIRDGGNLDEARRVAKYNALKAGVTEGGDANAKPAVNPLTGGIPAGKFYGQQRHQGFANPTEFIEQLYPYAKAAADKAGLAPEALLAQAALETGWGQRMVPGSQSGSSNNLFNIKADKRWDGDRSHVTTLEYNGTTARKEQAAFRVYDNLSESFDDFVRFLQDHPRYQQALAAGKDVKAFSEALQQAGYATDPAYAEKIQGLQKRLNVAAELPTLSATAATASLTNPLVAE